MVATDLRKNLFQTLEAVSQGNPVTIEYKGVSLRLEAISGKPKLAGAIRRNAIVGDPDALVSSDPTLLASLAAKWAIEDDKL